MVDVIIGLFILGFLFLGLREGLVKTLGSIVIIFLALFLATAALQFLVKVSPDFGNPNNLSAVIAFMVIWVIIAGVLDLLLGLLLQKIITITVLGPLDKFAGLFLGGFKGLLVAGIILQLVLAFPLPVQTKKRLFDSLSVKFSIATYQYAYPLAQKWAPYFNKKLKETLIEKIRSQGKMPAKVSAEVESITKMSPDEVMDKLIEYEKVKKEQESKIRQVLERQGLTPSPPVGKIK